MDPKFTLAFKMTNYNTTLGQVTEQIYSSACNLGSMGSSSHWADQCAKVLSKFFTHSWSVPFMTVVLWSSVCTIELNKEWNIKFSYIVCKTVCDMAPKDHVPATLFSNFFNMSIIGNTIQELSITAERPSCLLLFCKYLSAMGNCSCCHVLCAILQSQLLALTLMKRTPHFSYKSRTKHSDLQILSALLYKHFANWKQ